MRLRRGQSFVAMMFTIAVAGLFAQERNAVQHPQAPETQPSFTITISTPVRSIKVGSEVDLNIVTKNISARNIYHHVTNLGDRLEIDARDSRGYPVLETPYGLKTRRPLSGGITAASFSIPLKPGATFEEKVLFGRDYDLSKPDTYTIQVHRDDVLNEDEMTLGRGSVVKSNVINLIVIP
jgi:hypothetical protein